MLNDFTINHCNKIKLKLKSSWLKLPVVITFQLLLNVIMKSNFSMLGKVETLSLISTKMIFQFCCNVLLSVILKVGTSICLLLNYD